jgi:Sulfotransferase family
MTTPNQQFEPIFIVGAPRSGTTLLTIMLDRNDAIVMTPETKIFADLPLDWRGRKKQTHEQLINSFRYRTHLKDLKLEPAEVLQSFQCCEPTYQNYVRCVLECYRKRSGKPRIGEKSPEHMFDVPLILEWYPRAKIVWLLRDGRDNALTINRQFHTGFRRSSYFWRVFALLGLRWERRFPGRIFRVRYEDLIAHPAQTLESLCSFIEVPFQKQMLDTSIKTAVIPDHEWRHKKSSLGSLESDKVGEYKRSLTEAQLWTMMSVMEPILPLLGYPPTEAARCPFSVRMKNLLLNIPWSFVYNPSITRMTLRSPARIRLGQIWQRLAKKRSRGGPG